MKTITFEIKDLDFIDALEGEAFASVSLNPTFRWCKFILTDDQPNVNKHRIPQEEFDNLIRTGIHAPIKMAAGKIEDGHDNAFPLGVITALKKENNYIKGLAALWSEERPEDVELIKKRYDEGKPLDLSWEVLYREEKEEPDNVIALCGTALRATTFVGLPAYAGRTPITAVASVDGKENETTDNSSLEDTTVTVEELETKVSELETKLAEMTAMLTEKDALITEKETEIVSLKETNEALSSFKQKIEEEQAKASRIADIKKKFSEAGVEKPENYFDENMEMLLGLNDGALDFILQEFVSFASQTKTTSTSTSSVKIPNVTSSTTDLTPSELGKKLRETK